VRCPPSRTPDPARELIDAEIHYKLMDVETVRTRIAAVANLHMRATDRALATIVRSKKI
jgi:hypothetical protein